MVVHFKKADVSDSKKILKMQVESFLLLLDKYKDYDTNPACETLQKVKSRFDCKNIDHYFICLGDKKIGYIRIVCLDSDVYRLSQMFILPRFCGNGYAQDAIKQIELLYHNAQKWTLDTIKQENNLCYLYEKMGYRFVGVKESIKDGMDLVYYEKIIF